MRTLLLSVVAMLACASARAEIVGPDTPVILNPESRHPVIVPMGAVLCSRVPWNCPPPPPPEPIIIVTPRWIVAPPCHWRHWGWR